MNIIDDRTFISIDAYAGNVDESKKLNTTNKNESKSAVKEDKVELSSTAKKIREAKKIIDSIPEIRDQKIAQIKTQIENGTYLFREEKMATNMLKESLINDLLWK